MIRKGTWVEIHKIILKPGERAPLVPEDTRKVPLELKARGFLMQDAGLGDKATVKTLAGRKLTGTLCKKNPGYTHTFGSPHPELLPIGSEVRAILKEEDDEV